MSIDHGNLTSTDECADERPFPTGSIMSAIVREALVLLGGGRAVLLQLAHPLIADGVAQYSSFQSDPLARLHRTMFFIDAVVLRDDRRKEVLKDFHAMHAGIRGRLSLPAGRFRAGTPYSGTDPELKLWVHATLVDSCLQAYERFVRPLSERERQSYHADSRRLARLLKIPEALYPNSPAEFNAYMQSMLESATLAVTDATRRLADEVLHPEVAPPASMSAALLRFVTAGLMPPSFRESFGMRWSRRDEARLERMARTTRALRPHVPRWVWESPLHGGRLSRFLLWGAGEASPRSHHSARPSTRRTASNRPPQTRNAGHAICAERSPAPRRPPAG